MFHAIRQRFPNIAVEDAITIAMHSPAKEFYISERRALQFCTAIRQRRKISLKRGTMKYLCVMTIFYMARGKAANNNTSFRQAVIDTIYSEAPRFYFNLSTAYDILHQSRRAKQIK